MILYTCGQKTSHGRLPGPLAHPCGKAGAALEDAGHTFDVTPVAGYRALPWTRSGDQRAEIERLSGQKNVPILVLDDGTVVSGSGSIARWAKANPQAG